jgi:hypothetical protein
MSTYTKELQDEVERVTLKGNADKQTIRRLASIIFRLDQRILELEGKRAQEQEAKIEAPKEVPVPEVVQKKSISPVKGAVGQVKTAEDKATPTTEAG